MYAPSAANQLRGAQYNERGKSSRGQARKNVERILPPDDCGVKRKDYKGLWYGCGKK
jgi:hypothetical protein